MGECQGECWGSVEATLPPAQSLYRWVFPVIKDTANFDLKGRQEEAKAYLSNLMVLTESEKEYMSRFVSGEYRPDLLFDDPLILDNIRNHPMPEWKKQNM